MATLDDYAAFKLTGRRCTVCQHPQRDTIDLMLVGEVRHPDTDEQMTYEQIASWAANTGTTLSVSAIGRHYTNHVKPSWQQMLQTQRQVDAIAEATGRQLTLPSVLTNIMISKGLRFLDSLDEDALNHLDPIKLMRVMNEASRNAMNLERAEALLTKQTIAEVDEKLTGKLATKGIAPETIATIREELYGLTPNPSQTTKEAP
jgi:hypothetical protein